LENRPADPRKLTDPVGEKVDLSPKERRKYLKGEIPEWWGKTKNRENLGKLKTENQGPKTRENRRLKTELFYSPPYFAIADVFYA